MSSIWTIVAADYDAGSKEREERWAIACGVAQAWVEPVEQWLTQNKGWWGTHTSTIGAYLRRVIPDLAGDIDRDIGRALAVLLNERAGRRFTVIYDHTFEMIGIGINKE